MTDIGASVVQVALERGRRKIVEEIFASVDVCGPCPAVGECTCLKCTLLCNRSLTSLLCGCLGHLMALDARSSEDGRFVEIGDVGSSIQLIGDMLWQQYNNDGWWPYDIEDIDDSFP